MTHETRRAPAYLAHWVVKTARAQEMIDWYGHVFDAHVVHEDKTFAFLTWDEESHRLALIKLPSPVKLAFPLAKLRRKVYGIDHLAFGFDSLGTLLHKWEKLREIGIEPVWAINHGPTTSLYYEDPDGIGWSSRSRTSPAPGRSWTTSRATNSRRTRSV